MTAQLLTPCEHGRNLNDSRLPCTTSQARQPPATPPHDCSTNDRELGWRPQLKDARERLCALLYRKPFQPRCCLESRHTVLGARHCCHVEAMATNKSQTKAKRTAHSLRTAEARTTSSRTPGACLAMLPNAQATCAHTGAESVSSVSTSAGIAPAAMTAAVVSRFPEPVNTAKPQAPSSCARHQRVRACRQGCSVQAAAPCCATSPANSGGHWRPAVRRAWE